MGENKENEQNDAENEPLQAIDAAIKCKNYNLLIELFIKYDIELLLAKDMSKNKNKNEGIVTFEWLNQIIWIFSDLMVSNDDENNLKEISAEKLKKRAMMKSIKYLHLLMEKRK